MKTFLTIIGLFLFSLLHSQDVQFNDPSNSGTWINPSFLGGDTCIQLRQIQRLQWPKASAWNYVSYSVFSWYLPKGNLWIGASHHFENNAEIIHTNRYAFNLAKPIRIGKKFVLKPGIEIAYFKRKMDYSQLTFGDQIDPRFGFIYPTSDVERGGEIGNIDFSLGLSGFTRGFTFGISFHHLTEPSNSLLTGSNPLPMRIGAQLGYAHTFRIHQKDSLTVKPFIRSNLQVTSSVSFCGIQMLFRSISANYSRSVNDMIHPVNYFGIGYGKKHWRIQYSYMHQAGLKELGGAHEFGLSFRFLHGKSGKRYLPNQNGPFGS